MRFSRYVADHAGWLGIAGFLIATTDIFLLLIDGAGALMIYVAVSVLSAVFLGMYLDYRREKRFFEGVVSNIDALDQKYLLPEMIEDISSQEERMTAYILKEMERSMADRVAEYRRKSKEYREYIELWVHEVKIPIATAGMIIENHKDETIRETNIAAEIGRIRDYVEQALFYARSEAVEKDYLIKEIDLEDVAASVISDKKTVLRGRRAGLDIHDLNTDAKVLSDGKWLAFMIGQIIDNSVKYAKDGEPPRLEIFADEKDGRAALHIRDFGKGMKSGEVSRAFEKGFTGTNGRSGAASTGMGLYLCKKLCDRLGHEIELTSKEGEGTEVTLRF
ncbi:MAG: sensor histidine kinase [Lachnospiraceae bacterium]|jgi:signal transduction histidine kinase|nr:sensor histidine kinase [Lachnospiraceae bacterium]